MTLSRCNTRMLPIVLGVALTLCASGRAVAQSCSASTSNPSCTVAQTLTTTINATISLDMGGTGTTLASPTASDFNAGSNTTGGPTVLVQSNVSWSLNVAAAAATFTPASGPSGYQKPASDVDVTLNGVTKTLSTTNQALATAQPKTATYSNALSYLVRYSYTLDVPDTYTLVVNFTLSSP